MCLLAGPELEEEQAPLGKVGKVGGSNGFAVSSSCRRSYSQRLSPACPVLIYTIPSLKLQNLAGLGHLQKWLWGSTLNLILW